MGQTIMPKEQRIRSSKAPSCDHTSVGMLVWRRGNILLIERKRPPIGIAPPAGHVDQRPSFKAAAFAELEEEVGLVGQALKLVAEGRKDNPCRRGGTWHHWEIYDVVASGMVRPSEQEVKKFFWCSRAELRRLKKRTDEFLAGNLSESEWERQPGLEPVWCSWFLELGYLTDTDGSSDYGDQFLI